MIDKFELNKLDSRVELNKNKLLGVIKTIDESKAVLVDVPYNEEHITNHLRLKMGLNRSLDQSEIADFYEDDSQQSKYISNFNLAVSGRREGIDYKSIKRDKVYLQNDYSLGMEGVGDEPQLSGAAATAYMEFLTALES